MFQVIAENGSSRFVETRAEAEDVKADMEQLGMDVEIQSKATDGGTEVVETPEAPNTELDDIAQKDLAEDPPERNVSDDPLDILPGYMITEVDGKPSLNKRGVSVLAYEYDVSVIERDVVTYPHENGYETAVVEIMVENADGRTFSGIGEAHVDETPKHQLLRMAETRAYKRSVIFATGTGIVGYQELMSDLE